jgi:hypothetical protein
MGDWTADSNEALTLSLGKSSLKRPISIDLSRDSKVKTRQTVVDQG